LSAPRQTPPPVEHHEGIVPLPHSLKQKIKDGIVAVSLANLCFIKVGFDLLSDDDRYFNKLPATSLMLLALAVNLFGFALLAWLVMQMLRRFSNRWLHLTVHLMFLFLLLLPLDFVRLKFFDITDYQLVVFMKQPAAMVCGLALLALFAWKHRLIAKIAAEMVAVLSPLAVFMLVKITLVCLNVVQLKQCDSQVVLPPPVPVRAGQPRVVWIIFDELDYRMVFAQRPAGLQFPEFDRLEQQSLSAAGAYAPNDATIMSMPALILGERISDVSDADVCDLSITLADTGATTSWASQPSVFSRARDLGVNTALVGWYIPYDRMLPGALNFCAWYSFPLFEPARADTFEANMRQQVLSLGETLWLRQLFVNIHRDSLQVSLSVVTNSTYGLILLHLPAPHRPGVYLPKKNQFTIWIMSKVQGYLNNLALADHEFGELRHAMETSGEWDKTWIILSADHSWRESKLYDGRRDYRVPYLVKPPGTNEPMAYPQQFNTVLTHDLILAILRGEVANQQAVARWLDIHATQSATVIGGGGGGRRD
jgi:hypothetical protein